MTKAKKFSRCPLGFTALSEIDLCSAPQRKSPVCIFSFLAHRWAGAAHTSPMVELSAVSPGPSAWDQLPSAATVVQGAGGMQAGRGTTLGMGLLFRSMIPNGSGRVKAVPGAAQNSSRSCWSVPGCLVVLGIQAALKIVSLWDTPKSSDSHKQCWSN